MASIQAIPITPTPVAVSETRSVRADNRPVPVEQVVDMSPETRKLPDSQAQTGELAKPSGGTSSDAPLESALSDIRPVIERLDGAKDVAETLEAEEPDQEDRSMQAKDAYNTLRETDDEKTSVGTA